MGEFRKAWVLDRTGARVEKKVEAASLRAGRVGPSVLILVKVCVTKEPQDVVQRSLVFWRDELLMIHQLNKIGILAKSDWLLGILDVLSARCRGSVASFPDDVPLCRVGSKDNI